MLIRTLEKQIKDPYKTAERIMKSVSQGLPNDTSIDPMFKSGIIAEIIEYFHNKEKIAKYVAFY